MRVAVADCPQGLSRRHTAICAICAQPGQRQLSLIDHSFKRKPRPNPKPSRGEIHKQLI